MVAAMKARALFSLLGGVALVASCTGDESPYGEVENWDCFEAVRSIAAAGAAGAAGASASASAGQTSTGEPAPSCDCHGLPAGQHASDSRPKVSSCNELWLCCYAWPTAGGYDCRCEDPPSGIQAGTYCASAAGEVAGEVVDACPPTPKDNASYCAFDGESCEQSYLDENQLNGCCEDLECGADTHGNPACVPK